MILTANEGFLDNNECGKYNSVKEALINKKINCYPGPVYFSCGTIPVYKVPKYPVLKYPHPTNPSKKVLGTFGFPQTTRVHTERGAKEKRSLRSPLLGNPTSLGIPDL